MSEFAGRRVLVLLGDRTQSFYGYTALAICKALGRVGASAVHLETPHVSEVTRKLPPERILEAIRAHKCTDVYAVNIPPALAIPGAREAAYTDSELKTTEELFAGLPLGFRWHTHIQDPYDANSELPKRSFETRWNWVRRWGEPLLQPCTDYGRYLKESDGYDYDVGFIGYMPAQALSFANTDPRHTVVANVLYENILRSWDADGDAVNLHVDAPNIEATIKMAEKAKGLTLLASCRPAFAHFLAEAGVRFWQRNAVMARVVAICKARGWRLAISGMGWERIEGFEGYAIGHCVSGEMMAHLSQRTKVNLHMGVETLFHNRPLEVFACGAFCLSWCPGDVEDEGLGLPLFNLSNLEERLDYWVKRQEARMEVVGRIGDDVRKFFTFEEMVTRMLRGASDASDDGR